MKIKIMHLVINRNIYMADTFPSEISTYRNINQVTWVLKIMQPQTTAQSSDYCFSAWKNDNSHCTCNQHCLTHVIFIFLNVKLPNNRQKLKQK